MMGIPGFPRMEVPRNRGLPGFLRSGVALSPSTGRAFGPNVPRLESGPWEEGTTNLLTANQSSVETDLSNISVNVGCTIARDTTTAVRGGASLRVTTLGGQVGEGVAFAVTCSVGLLYTFSVYVKGTGTIRLRFGGALGGSGGNVVLTSEWQRISLTGIMQAASGFALIETAGTAQATVFWADGLQFEQKSYATPWVLGGTSRPTIYNSGTLLVEESAQNLMTLNQSNVETDTSGFNPGGGSTVARVTSQAKFGSASLQVNAPAATYGVNTTPLTLTGVAAGTQLTFSVFVLNPSGSIRVYAYPQGGSTVMGSSVPSSASWQRVTLPFTTAVSNGTVFFEIFNAQGVAHTFYVDGLQLEAKTYPTSWHPGGATRAAETYTIPTAGILSPTQGAIGLWFKPGESLGSGNRILFDTRPALTHTDLTGYIGAAKKLIYLVGTGVGTYALTGTTVLDATVMRFAVFRWSGAGTAMFLNGVLEASSAVVPGLSFGSLMRVGANFVGGEHLNGLFSAMWTTTELPTDSQIAAWYASGEPFPTGISLTLRQDFRRRGRGLVL